MSDQTWKKAILAIYWLLWDGHSALIEIFINNSHPTQATWAVHCPSVHAGEMQPWNHIWRFGEIIRSPPLTTFMTREGAWEKVAPWTFYLKSEHQPRIGKKYWKLRSISMILQEKQRPCWCLVLVSDCHGQELRKNARSLAAAAQWGDQNWD